VPQAKNKKKSPARKAVAAKSAKSAKTPKRAVPASAGGSDPARVRSILEGLEAAYPEAHCELHYENAWQLLMATIMSAQCTDAVVNIVTETLFQKYPTPEALAYANPADIEQIIRPTGFFRNKTKSIMGASKKIVEEFGGQVPRTMEQLLTVPGAARKTSNVVLGTAFGIASGVVVDTHVMRLSNRLDLTRHSDPKKIELDLMKVIPQDRWIKFSHQLIWHGRRVCVARKPRCIDCNLEKICYSKDKTINTQAKRLR
jgi:endonuclease-3